MGVEVAMERSSHKKLHPLLWNVDKILYLSDVYTMCFKAQNFDEDCENVFTSELHLSVN